MKIEDRYVPSEVLTQSSRTSSAQLEQVSRYADGKKIEVEAGADSAELSGLAYLSARALNTESTERNARIQAISEQYKSGNYKVDPQELGRTLAAKAFEG